MQAMVGSPTSFSAEEKVREWVPISHHHKHEKVYSGDHETCINNNSSVGWGLLIRREIGQECMQKAGWSQPIGIMGPRFLKCLFREDNWFDALFSTHHFSVLRQSDSLDLVIRHACHFVFCGLDANSAWGQQLSYQTMPACSSTSSLQGYYHLEIP